MTAKEPQTREPSLEAAKSDPMQAELTSLRAQLDALKASREAEAKPQPRLLRRMGSVPPSSTK